MASPFSAAEKLEILHGLLSPEAGARLVRASTLPLRRRHSEGEVLPTGVEGLDRLLGGGLPPGQLVELSGRRSSGRFAAGLSILAAATQSGRCAALVDLGDGLSPHGAAEAGVDLARLLWVRPRRLREAVFAAEVALAAGFLLVAVDLGPCLRRRGGVPDSAWVRLARRARERGTTLLVLAPRNVCGAAAGTAIEARRERASWVGQGRAPKLLAAIRTRWAATRLRGATPGREEAAEWRSGER